MNNLLSILTKFAEKVQDFDLKFKKKCNEYEQVAWLMLL